MEHKPVPRMLSESGVTRYVEISSQYDADDYWRSAIRRTEVSFSDEQIVIYKLSSDELPTKVTLSIGEMTTLITAYTAYLYDREARSAVSESEASGDHPL